MSQPLENGPSLRSDLPAEFVHPAEKLPDELQEFSTEERALLLAEAHQAISITLQGRFLSLASPSPHLSEPRGVFTTLYHRGELRGCVGYVLPRLPLFQAVAETARAAAFEDIRFSPLTPQELPELAVSISVLSALRPVHANEIEIGRHGLLIKYGSSRGLFLPQVAVEHHWNVKTFLEQTCRKAGLSPEAWQMGARIEAFTAESFGDRSAV
jgi:AmmeMemoRadiSam system protein A